MKHVIAALVFLGLGMSALMARAYEERRAAQPSFKKVFTVVLENTDFQVALKQPFMHELASKGALLDNFFAVKHPSQPNYIAMVSGSTQGVTGDDRVNLNVRHIGDLLEAKGMSWKAYAEGYPGNCFQGQTAGRYVRRHVPFISFINVQKSPSRCAQIVDATQLDQDIADGKLPDYSLYVPNLDDDGHDSSPAYADRWLSQNFGDRLKDPKFMDGMLFIVTFDEGSTTGTNQIFTLLYGNSVTPGSASNLRYDHYSVLRMIEDAFGLGTLGLNDATANPIAGIWR